MGVRCVIMRSLKIYEMAHVSSVVFQLKSRKRERSHKEAAPCRTPRLMPIKFELIVN